MNSTGTPLSAEQMGLLLHDAAALVDAPVERLLDQAVRHGAATRRRRRRIKLASVCVAAIAVTGAVMPLRMLLTSPPAATQPGGSASPSPRLVTAAELPGHIERSARSVLEPRVDLGPAAYEALDANLQPIPDTTDPSLAAVAVRFGTASHTWRVFLGPAVDPPTTGTCRAGAPSGTCDFVRYDDGTVVTTSVVTMMKQHRSGPHYVVGDLPPLDTIALADLRFERNVRAIRPDGTMTSVTEQVTAPTTRVPDEAFASPAVDLLTLAVAPTLRLPRTP